MARNIKGRIDRLTRENAGGWADVLALIRAGKTYAQLSDDQKERYCAYRRTDRKTMEEVHRLLFGECVIDFPLVRNEVLTEREKRDRITEIADWIEKYIKEGQK